MSQRGTGTITVDGVSKSFGSPATMPTMAQPVEDPEEARMKKFYTEQYNIEAQNFAKQKMSQTDFDKGIGNLQTKYRLAYNEAEMKNRPDPAYKQYRDLDLYRDRLLERRAERFSMQDKPNSWFTGSQLMIRRDPYSDYKKKNSWDPKLTAAEKQEAADLDNEISSVDTRMQMLIRPNLSDLGNAAIKSPRIGGPIRDQARALIEQRQGNTQQQSGEIINRGGKQWRIVGHDTDGTPLVEEVR